MKLIKEIRSKEGKLHFRRWELLKTKWFSIWIHGIYESDQDLHLHNHPWDFKSIVLKGSYIELTEKGFVWQTPLKFNSRNGENFHKIYKLLTPVVYTLFFVTPTKREWGYEVNGEFITHEKYRELKKQGKLK
jgi:hypothetical protein